MSKPEYGTLFRLDRSYVGAQGICIKQQAIVSYPAHSHSYYEMAFYTGGTGILHINGETLTVNSPIATLITPADFHSISKADGKLHSIKISFDSTRLPDADILPNHAVVWEPPAEDRIGALFEECAEKADQIKYISYLIAAIILKLRQNGRSVPETSNDSKYQHVAAAITYINLHFCEPLSLSETAKAQHISPQYLSTLFKAYLGIPFSRYVTRLRLHYAAELLTEQKKNVTEIALLCGYQNLSHFLRCFKAEFGITPGEFQKQTHHSIS